MIKKSLSLLSIALLTACNGGGSDSIDRLVEEGLMPELDQSEGAIANDLNDNGVRDEIEDYIANKPNTTESQKTVLLKNATTIQKTLTVQSQGGFSQDEQAALDKELIENILCLQQTYGDHHVAAQALSELESMTANTQERKTLYNDFNASQNGTVTRLPASVDCGE